MKKGIYIRITPEILQQLRAEAEKFSIGYTTLVRQIVEEYLDNKKDICE